MRRRKLKRKKKRKKRMSETQLVKKILKVLREQGGWWIKTHGGPFQQSGLPDIIGSLHGKFIGLEVKKPGKVTSKIQKHVINQIFLKGGGKVAVVTSVQDVLIFLSPIWMNHDERKV